MLIKGGIKRFNEELTFIIGKKYEISFQNELLLCPLGGINILEVSKW